MLCGWRAVPAPEIIKFETPELALQSRDDVTGKGLSWSDIERYLWRFWNAIAISVDTHSSLKFFLKKLSIKYLFISCNLYKQNKTTFTGTVCTPEQSEGVQ